MKALITIILPVHNGEAYLENAIRSVIDQKYKDWKLVIVDDGSTDGTAEICQRFADIDDRISVIHQKNRGVSCALNTGLNNTDTPYLTFVDADDKIREDTLSENMKYLLTNPHLKVLQYPVYQRYGTDFQYITKNDPELISIDFYGNWLRENKISWITNDKIYRTELFNDLKFKEGIVFEDNLMMLKLLEKLSNIYLSDKGMYYYYERENSITTSTISLQREMDSFYVTYQIFNKLKDEKLYDLAAEFLVRLINIRKSLKINFNHLAKDLKKDDADFLKLLRILKLNLPLKSKIKLFRFKISG